MILQEKLEGTSDCGLTGSNGSARADLDAIIWRSSRLLIYVRRCATVQVHDTMKISYLDQ